MDNIITSKSREVKHCPPHFTKVPVKIKSSMFANALARSATLITDQPENKIRDWCHENIEHRFFIGNSVESTGVDHKSQTFIVEAFVAAFEDPTDATYFTLLLPSFLD